MVMVVMKNMVKMVGFWFKNLKNIVSEDGIFSMKTLKGFRAIVKTELPNGFCLSKGQAELMFKYFVVSNKVFDASTPFFILLDERCIIAAVKRDIDSVDYLREVDEKIEAFIIEEVISKGYILKKCSPTFLKKNYKVAKNSAMLDISSVDYMLWSFFTEEEQSFLLKMVLASDYSLSSTSCKFLLTNKDVVLALIKRNVDNVDFIDKVDKNLENLIGDELVNQNYVLKKCSPKFVKSNYQIVKNSIKLDVSSANNVLWDELDVEEKAGVLDVLLDSDYVLSCSSPCFLRSNKDVALLSVKNDIFSFNYVIGEFGNSLEILLSLVEDKYRFSSSFLKKRNLRCLSNDVILDYYFDYFKLCEGKIEQVKTRFKNIVRDSLKSRPKLEDFSSFFQVVLELDWNSYKRKNANMYENVFGKISSELRRGDYSFEESVANLEFLLKMKFVLGQQKYDILYKAMGEYYNYLHMNVGGLDSLQIVQDTIAKSSALYVSKSKEIYKSENIRQYYELIFDYFKIRLDSSAIKKKIIEKRKKEEFIFRYEVGEEDILNFINSIIDNYGKHIGRNLAEKMVKGFIIDNYFSINDFIPIPDRFEEFLNYEKVIKLINRLNSCYIDIDGIEVKKYKHLIKFDEKFLKYSYAGGNFSSGEKRIFRDYKEKIKIFNKLKKEIMFKVMELNVLEEVDDYLLKENAFELDFNDFNFEFDIEKCLTSFSYDDLYRTLISKINLDILDNDEAYAYIYDMLVVNGYWWILMILNYDHNRLREYCCMEIGICLDKIIMIINNMDKIVPLSKEFKIDISSFNGLFDVYKMSKCAGGVDVAILGKEIIKKLCLELKYTNKDERQIIMMAKELVCQMSKRSSSTVPYVSGVYLNYKYSMYDSLDRDMLICGIDTNSCFKVGGVDNDFLHYCALNKNGFVIKIIDNFGNFVGKASGFRNGNVVYINQLRSIYDIGGNSYDGIGISEKEEIIMTLKKVCEDIVTTSWANSDESDKIDFVFVTKSYILSHIDSNLDGKVENFLSFNTIENKSTSWKEYKRVTKNLKEVSKNKFTTDFGIYPLLCMAASKKEKEIYIKDIKYGDVKAVYERKRNKIVVTKVMDAQIMVKLNKIKAIKCYFDNSDFEEVVEVVNAVVFSGDNWYIILKNGLIIDECLLDFDDKAKREYDTTIEVINNSNLDNICNDSEVSEMLTLQRKR